MESTFLHLLNMSITAGWLVLAVVVLRLVFRRAPKWIHCLLWVLVAVRLLCPVSVESVLSLIPSIETVPVETFLYDVPTIHSGVPVVDAVVNPIISNGFSPNEIDSVNPMQVVSIVAAYVWALGMAAMLLYAVITTLRLRRRVREAAYVRDNVWQCDRIHTPFILGIIRPRIYLPTLLGAEEAKSVIAHEQAHLARRDHWWKPLGFLLLTVYWFNPLLWLGYVLLCRDIEAACDERVVKNMDGEQRKEYSRVLLACSAPRHLVTACPLAFGETGVKSRIQSVLNYKKPAFWLIITAIVATVVAAVCLLTNPKTSISKDMDAFLSEAIIRHNRGEHTGDAYPTEAHTVFGVRKAFGRTTVYGMVLYEEYYVDESGALQVQSGSHCPTILTVGKDADGNDMLLDYWTPRDGADYARDIRDRFPARHQGKAFDTEGYYRGHHAATYQQARRHFEPWQTALTQAILTQNRIEYDPAVYAAEDHRIYEVSEGDGRITVYALVYYHEYAMVDGSLAERSGSLVPTAITFLKNVDTYELVEYWTPTDHWSESIREKFPQHLWETVLDYKNYPVEEMKNRCRTQAEAYFGVRDVFTAPLTFSAMNWLNEDKLAALYADLPENYLPVIPITNRSELDAFIAAYKKEMNFDRAEGDGLTPIHQMSFYDDAFFAEKVLLAVYYKDGSCSVQPKIGDVNVEPNGLQVQVDVYEPEAGDTALGQWFMLCEVNRAAIPNVQNYTAVVRSHIPLEGANTFAGRVTQVTDNGKMMLMDCYDTDKFTEVWVSLQNVSDAHPQVGEEYIVTHDQWVLETYPPQVTALRIIPVSSTPTTTTSQPTTTTITAFTPKPKTPAQLSAKQEAEIKQCWVSLYVDPELEHTVDAVEITYYGIYNGYVALIIKDNYWGHLTAHSEEEIAGVLFEYPTSNRIRLWKNGEFFEVAQVYKNGKITQTDVQNIAYYYSNRLGATNTTKATTTTTTIIPTTTTTAPYIPNTKKTTELTEQQKEKIVSDFAHYLWYEEEWRNYENLEQTKQSCAFRAYYGTYNGYMAVQMGTGFGPAMITEHDVAEGYYFSVNGDEHLYLYRDGKFIGMSGAYASGLITEQDLKDIWYYAHGGQYPVKGPVHGDAISYG